MSKDHQLRVGIDARGAAKGAAVYAAAGKRIERSSKRTHRAVARVDAGLANMSVTTANAWRAITGVTAVLGVQRILSATVRTLGSFDDAMQTTRAISHATAEEFAALSHQARKLGAITQYTATQAAEGLAYLARAGFSAGEAFHALPHVLALAAAGEIEVGEAADWSSNILQAFSMQVSELGRVVDTMVNTASSANTNVRQLAEALKYAAPIAGDLGVEIEEAAAVIGVLADAAIQSGMAGTQFRKIMLSIIGPTGQAERALKDLGMTQEQLEDSFRAGIAGMFEELRGNAMDAGDAFQLFGLRAVSGSMVLSKAVDKMRELQAANKDASGEAMRIAGIMADDIPGAWKRLKSALSEMILQFGDAGLTGALRNVLEYGGEVVRVLIGMDDPMRSINASARMTAEAFRLIATYAALLAAGKLLFWLGGVTAGLLSVGKAMKALKLAWASNPLGLAIIALAAIGTALYSYRDTLIEVGDKSVKFGALLISIWESVSESAKHHWGLTSYYISLFYTALVEETKNKIQAVADASQGLWDYLLRKATEDMIALGVISRKQLEDAKRQRKVAAQAMNDNPFADGDVFNAWATAGMPEATKQVNSYFDDIAAGYASTLPPAERLAFETWRAAEGWQAIVDRAHELSNLEPPKDPTLPLGADKVKGDDPVKREITDQFNATAYAAEGAAEAISTAVGEFARGLEDSRTILITMAESLFDSIIQAMIVTPMETILLNLFGKMLGNFGLESQASTQMLMAAQAHVVAAAQLQVAAGQLTASSAAGAARAAGAATAAVRPAMAQGGIIGNATVVHTPRSQVIAGESGPEAIMPLTRMPGGNLGVATSGRSVVINMTINALDANSFRRSDSQIASSIKRKMGGFG